MRTANRGRRKGLKKGERREEIRGKEMGGERGGRGSQSYIPFYPALSPHLDTL